MASVSPSSKSIDALHQLVSSGEVDDKARAKTSASSSVQSQTGQTKSVEDNPFKRLTRATTASGTAPPTASLATPKRVASAKSPAKYNLKADRPIFGKLNAEYKKNGLPQYPEHTYQNALDLPEEQFLHVSGPGPAALADAQIQSDMDLMRIPTKQASRTDKKREKKIVKPDLIVKPLELNTVAPDDEFVHIPPAEVKQRPARTKEQELKRKLKALESMPQPKSQRPANTASDSVNDSSPIMASATADLSPAKRGEKRAADEDSTPPSTKRLRLTVKPRIDETASPESTSSLSSVPQSPPKLKLGRARRGAIANNETPPKSSNDSQPLLTPDTMPPINPPTMSAYVPPSRSAKRKRSATNAPPIEPDSNESAASPSPVKKKQKKGGKSSSDSNFVGDPSNHGYSNDRPSFGTLETPWQCAQLNCATGMTWEEPKSAPAKDGKKSIDGKARKVISQYFGRNKAATTGIPFDVWHVKCRKHYQQQDYANKNSQEALLIRLADIGHQVTRLQIWRPQAKFTIQLNTGGEKRLAAFYAALPNFKTEQEAADSLPQAKLDDPKATPEKHSDALLSKEFKLKFAKEDQTYDDLRNVLAWLEQEVKDKKKNVRFLCPLEFIMNAKLDDEETTPAAENFQRWEASITDGAKFDPSTAYDLPKIPLPVQGDTVAKAEIKPKVTAERDEAQDDAAADDGHEDEL